MATQTQADSTTGAPVVKQPAGRFGRPEATDQTHEERGLGWRARWSEGAERLNLVREPIRRAEAARRKRRS